MAEDRIAENIRRVGVMDTDIDLFEGQYPVPDGVSYNTYLIVDEQTALLDTVDLRKQDEWMSALTRALGGRMIDHLVISHMEPDHAGSVRAFAERFPNAELIGNKQTFAMLDQFTGGTIASPRRVVGEGDTLALGAHTLRFFTAPMVHWPEVMVCYEETEKILFAADGFGRFGSMDARDPWEAEARRYYFNIVGKYGAQVQALLKKAAKLDIRAVCPLHGPVLEGEALSRALELYNTWSSYKPQESGVLVAFAGFHGHTAEAARLLADQLIERSCRVSLIDLAREHVSYAVAEAFRYDRMVLACTTYDGEYAPAMRAFLTRLAAKGYQSRTVALIENGTWAPMAARKMREALDGMKNIAVLGEPITIRSAMNLKNREQIEALAAELDELG